MPYNPGYIIGPGSSTDNVIPRFDGTTGKLLQGGGPVVADDGAVTLTGASSITAAASTDLTLAGGSSGASFIVGSGSSIFATLNALPSATTGALIINTSSGDTTTAIHYKPAATHYNWLVGAQINTNQTFQITPSTAVGGSTFSTPSVTIYGATGNLLIGGTTDISGSGNLAVSGYAITQKLVSVKTQAASPYAVSATLDNRVAFTNEGTTAMVTFTLPTAAANLDYTFIVQDADGITITANTGDTIRFGATVTAAAGSISSTTIGSVIRLTAINATEWIATSLIGTWA